MHGIRQTAHGVTAIGADPESPSAYGRSKGEGERVLGEEMDYRREARNAAEGRP